MDHLDKIMPGVNYKITHEQIERLQKFVKKMGEVIRKVIQGAARFIKNILDSPKFKELVQKCKGLYVRERKSKILVNKKQTFKPVKSISMKSYIFDKR